jgi:cell wall-associated NlpC family hydrolase
MNYGVINQSLAALRREPFEKSEMVSQLLFGETFAIHEQHKGWLRVTVTHDTYEGWLDSKLCLLVNADEYLWTQAAGAHKCATQNFMAQRDGSEHPIHLCAGSSIYHSASTSTVFSLPQVKYNALSSPFDGNGHSIMETIQRRALYYINSPYLWGGRSPFGIDCSGLVQVVFKSIGYYLPRDASQQVVLGEIIDFVNMTQTGDLAFFDNEEGAITHVGIVLPEGRIIHSSGYVRIDKLDQQGIYCSETRLYTHRLRIIKRIL